MPEAAINIFYDSQCVTRLPNSCDHVAANEVNRQNERLS
jgi:hypothetical protein